MKRRILISTGGSGGHVVPATVLYEHLQHQFQVSITSDHRGIKFLNKNNYDLKIYNVPPISKNIFLIPFQFFLLLYLIIKSVFFQLKWNAISKLLLMFGFIAYSLKIVMQVFSSFPYFVEKSLALKPFLIIGYLHLFTLGFMSVMLLLILIEFGKIALKSSFSKIGVYLFLTGILITELLFFLQGFGIMIGIGVFQNYNRYLLIFSGFIVIGLIFIYFNQFRNRVA